jgi:AraC family transcriptional regulator, regulatory protein of adaptative response / DNA-3-methyladenine glycosylase II
LRIAGNSPIRLTSDCGQYFGGREDNLYGMKGLPDLSRDVLDRARLSRDARFDGRFFIAIISEGTYCRPICPIAASNNGEVRYFALAAEAAEQGFRPCLRCRPEAAPGLPAWAGSSAVVRRAQRLIQNGVLDHGSIDDVAKRLGISGRHLGRLFTEHIGASPTTVAQTRRLNFARRLLDETRLPIAAIALASGFASVRRFNDAFLTNYRISPTKLRLRSDALADEGGATDLKLELAYRPPYDWTHLLSFMSKRAIRGIEAVEASEYVRALRTSSGHALIRVRRAEGADALDVRIRSAAPSDLMPLLASVQRMFDLTADPARIADALRTDPLLRPLIERRPGLRIPGAADPFECCVRAILGKGLGASEARALLGKLVLRLGQRIDASPYGITHLFPTPDAIADSNLAEFDLSEQRRRTLQQVARAAQNRTIAFDESSAELERELAELTGVGRWVAGYVALRGLGEGDALPYGDLVLRREASSREFPLSAQELSARAARWRPFRGYAAFHLWSHAATREATCPGVNREESK